MEESVTIVVPEIIKQRLKNAKITEAAIIDDTFDEISSEMLGNGFDTFVGALEDSEVFREVQVICAGLEEATDFDVDRARELWAARNAWGERVKPHAELLFNNYVQRLATLNHLAANLEQLELKVYKLGANTAPPKSVSLVFLDYCLQPEKEVALAETRLQQITTAGRTAQGIASELLAETIAKRLVDLGVDRPFLVLISDRTELSQVHDDFRRRTKYLGGTFACLGKTKASDQETLYFHLGCWGIGHPALGPIRQFFDAALTSMDKTAIEFKETLLALDAQDYSFIQRLSLSADGEPLGEYMLDLLGAALSHRLRSQKEVCDAKTVLDGQHFSTHLPSVTQPSSELRRLYQDATTEPNVGELAPHPLHKLQTPLPPLLVPRLILGDILAKNENEPVYMVLNAGCDLQFSPISPDRHADPDLPIYLMPGKLEPLSHSTSNPAAKRTELFELHNKPYRIVWDHKHVFTVALGQFQKWCEDKQYQRVDRLALVQALAMQQIWTSDSGRVGLMVTPPLTESADFQVYLRNAENKLEPFEGRIRGQVILGSHLRENKHVEWFFLTREGMLQLHAALKTVSGRFKLFEQAAVEPRKTEKIAELQRLGSRADSSVHDWESWFQLLEREHELPRSAGPRAPSNSAKMPVAFCWQTYPAGKGIQEFGGKNVFMVIDILRPEVPDHLPDAVPVAEPNIVAIKPSDPTKEDTGDNRLEQAEQVSTDQKQGTPPAVPEPPKQT